MASSPFLVAAAGVELTLCGAGTLALTQHGGAIDTVSCVLTEALTLAGVFVGALLFTVGVLSCAWAGVLSGYFDSPTR